jgi:hypothetical protein
VVANFTADAPVKPVPVTITAVPTDPAVGEKLETVGPVAHAGAALTNDSPQAAVVTPKAISARALNARRWPDLRWEQHI